MILGNFHSLVSASLRRGTTLDSFIPQQVELAVQWIERNYTFKYMEKFKLLQVVAGDRTIALPQDAILKGFKFIRLINSDGSYSYLKKVEPEDLPNVLSVTNTLTAQTIPSANGLNNPFIPTAYFVVGLATLVLNAIPTIDLSGESLWYQYTDWPTDLSSQHPLLAIASDLLLAQTQMFMAVNIMKDQRMLGAYKELRDEAVNTMTRAEDENRLGGEAISMIFNPEWDARIANMPEGANVR